MMELAQQLVVVFGTTNFPYSSSMQYQDMVCTDDSDNDILESPPPIVFLFKKGFIRIEFSLILAR